MSRKSLGSYPYLDVGFVASVFGWTARKTKRRLGNSGVLVKRGGKYYVSTDLLAREYCEAYQRVLLLERSSDDLIEEALRSDDEDDDEDDEDDDGIYTVEDLVKTEPSVH